MHSHTPTRAHTHTRCPHHQAAQMGISTMSKGHLMTEAMSVDAMEATLNDLKNALAERKGGPACAKSLQ